MNVMLDVIHVIRVRRLVVHTIHIGFADFAPHFLGSALTSSVFLNHYLGTHGRAGRQAVKRDAVLLL